MLVAIVLFRFVRLEDMGMISLNCVLRLVVVL
jgi:hypothetical protein